MAKAYWVVTYRKITNQEKWGAYAKIAVPALQGSGGKLIARGMPAKIYEKGINDRVPKTPEEWENARHGAIRVIEGANLLRMPGRHVARPGEKSATPGVDTCKPVRGG